MAEILYALQIQRYLHGNEHDFEAQEEININYDKIYQVHYIFSFLCLSLNICFGLLSWYSLIKLDKDLPKERRVMDGFMRTCFWLVCCFTSLFGTVCFYYIAKHQIEQRHLIFNSPELARAVPIAIANLVEKPVSDFDGLWKKHAEN